MTALLVVDASVVVKWYTDEPDSPSARSILISGTDLIAPDVIVAEVLNALWSKRRKGLMPHLDLDELICTYSVWDKHGLIGVGLRSVQEECRLLFI